MPCDSERCGRAVCVLMPSSNVRDTTVCAPRALGARASITIAATTDARQPIQGQDQFSAFSRCESARPFSGAIGRRVKRNGRSPGRQGSRGDRPPLNTSAICDLHNRTDADPDGVRGDRRSRDRRQPVRAAGAARAALGERDRRPAAAGRDRASGSRSTFTITIVGARVGGRRRGRRGRRRAHGGDRRCCSRFGLALLVPAVGDRLEAPLSRLARFGPALGRHGLLVGPRASARALGFLYAPCAGPILAAVDLGRREPAAARRRSSRSRSPTRSARRRCCWCWRSAAAASPSASGRPARGPAAPARRRRGDDRDGGGDGGRPRRPLPDRAREPLPGLHREPDGVARALARRRAAPGRHPRQVKFASRPRAAAERRGHRTRRSTCPCSAGARLHGHPALVQHPRRAAAAPRRRCGASVVLIDFWTYTCINCIRTLPYVKAWDARYRDRGLTIVGVHTPEFGFEQRRRERRATRSAQNGLRYPVAQDNDYGTWNAWGNQYWPAKYLIDARGQVRYTHFGEGDYGKTEAAIRSLLARGARRAARARAHARAETALDPAPDPRDLPRLRASRPVPPVGRQLRDQPTTAPYRGRLPLSHLALGGTTGTAARRPRQPAGATLRLASRRGACTSCSARREAWRGASRVLLDGRPVRPATPGPTSAAASVTVRGPAPLPAGRPAPCRAARARAPLRARHLRLRVHVRLSGGAPARAAAADAVESGIRRR